jgi:hypothetical protein
VVEITPLVSSFRRKRRKINFPIFDLDSSQSKSKGSDCDEDSEFRRDKEKGANEEEEKQSDAYGYADFREPIAIDLTNKIDSEPMPNLFGEKGRVSRDGPKRSSRLILKNASTSSEAHLRNSPINISCSSTSSIAIRKTTRSLASNSGALLSAKSLESSCVKADPSYESSRQCDASGCGAAPSRKTSTSSGCIRKGGDVREVTKECAGDIVENNIACSSTLSRKNKYSTVTNEPGGVANEFTNTVDDINFMAPHTALAQSESDICFDSNNSVCGSYGNQDCSIRSARAGPDGGPEIGGECNSNSSSSSRSSSSTLKTKSMMVGSSHRRSSTSEEGCVEGSRVQTQRNAALAVSACPSSPPKTSHEGRIFDVADGSRCTRSYTAIALPSRDGLPAPPLLPLIKKYPSTSRSRMSSSLSAAYGSTLSSHSGGGSDTSSSTMRSGPTDRHSVKRASSGAEGGVVSSVAIQPLQSVSSSSHASVAQRLSRSGSLTSSISSAAALAVPPRPSLPPTSSRDYRHSSFRARKMLQAAEQIVNRNKNDQL